MGTEILDLTKPPTISNEFNKLIPHRVYFVLSAEYTGCFFQAIYFKLYDSIDHVIYNNIILPRRCEKLLLKGEEVIELKGKYLCYYGKFSDLEKFSSLAFKNAQLSREQIMPSNEFYSIAKVDFFKIFDFDLKQDSTENLDFTKAPRMTSVPEPIDGRVYLVLSAKSKYKYIYFKLYDSIDHVIYDNIILPRPSEMCLFQRIGKGCLFKINDIISVNKLKGKYLHYYAPIGSIHEIMASTEFYISEYGVKQSRHSFEFYQNEEDEDEDK